jgi:hypothetical protein
MKIANASVLMSSQHQQQHYHHIKETLTESTRPAGNIDRNSSNPRPASQIPDSEAPPQETQRPEIPVRNLNAGQNSQPADRAFLQITPSQISDNSLPLSNRTSTGELQQPPEPAYLDLFTLLVQSFTGREIEPIKLNMGGETVASISVQQTAIQPTTAGSEMPPDTIIDYHREERYFESESTHFTASGNLTTEDGRKISIDLKNAMHYQYSFEEEINLTLSSRQLLDPLVLNLRGSNLTLSEQRYAFDLNADGRDDNTHFVTGSSAFLALDKNGDGAINNGYELFGAITGQGFAELAVYDEDQNGFIDEADDIYQQLKLYNKDSEGNDQFFSLQEQGIGAIHLGYHNTPFNVKSADNELLAVVRASGIYITEEGDAGTIQQIDLTV